ncbi:MAG: hypothetical protein ACRDSQ_22380, partial [Actinokineospora sp.]
MEIRNAATGALEGTWRIESIGADGKTVVLAADGASVPTVDEGDRWQGVYRFDEYTVKGDVEVVSVDPIRVYSEQVITGTVETDAIYADRLVIKPNAVLTQKLTPSSAAPESLRIEVRELVVEAGGTIDVSSRGYPAGQTYPGHAMPSTGHGGSHLGEGGSNPLDGGRGETFGSVYFPRENGGASVYVRGGGAVQVVAERAVIDGVIRADGQSGCRGGAGGSVWVKTLELSGTGTIEAKGGTQSCGGGSGGGGAIAVEYTRLAAGTTLLEHLVATGGDNGYQGGAGTVYVRGGRAATYGHLIVDNKA